MFSYYLLNANVDVLRIHNSRLVKRVSIWQNLRMWRSSECELCFVFGRTTVRISARKLPITTKVLRSIHHYPENSQDSISKKAITTLLHILTRPLCAHLLLFYQA